VFGDENADKNFLISESDLTALIDEWVTHPRDNEILKLRLITKLTLEQIADKKHYSVSGIKKILYKYMKNLDKKIIEFKKST
jgi:hypothetical protein